MKLPSKFIEITLRNRCSPVNLLHIFKTSFPTNMFKGLLPNLRNNLPEILSENFFWIISLNSEVCNFIKVARVVKLKLAFSEWFFITYHTDQVIKYLIRKFRQNSIISEKPGYLFEKLKSLTLCNYQKV